MLTRFIAIAGALAATQALAQNQAVPDQAPPPAPYAQVSELADLPEFIPGLGTLYVDPATLPTGPFLAYDRNGTLSATVYMPPLAALEGGTAFDDLNPGSDTVTSVDIYYHAGHPGVEEPHAHVVLYPDAEAKARLAE